MTDFRDLARESLKEAKRELAGGDDTRLKYAALCLRMAIEAIVYGRALSYSKYIPSNQIEAWQPSKVLEKLLEVDPTADLGSHLFVGMEETPGVEADEKRYVGEERTLTLKVVRENYHAIGGFLHQPSLKQFRLNELHSSAKMRKRCEAILAMVESVLSSPMFNMNFGQDCDFACLQCGKEIARRTPAKEFKFEITCDCGAEYELKGAGVSDPRTVVTPLRHTLKCPTETCNAMHDIWRFEERPGTAWHCPECNEDFEIAVVISNKNALTRLVKSTLQTEAKI